MYMVRTLIGLTLWDQLRVAWRSLVSCGAMVVTVLLVNSMFPPIRSTLQASEMLVVLVVVGALTYCGVHALLWLLAGRPGQGIETELASILERLMGRFGRQKAPAE
jgi:PST family polysaccharide transporter